MTTALAALAIAGASLAACGGDGGTGGSGPGGSSSSVGGASSSDASASSSSSTGGMVGGDCAMPIVITEDTPLIGNTTGQPFLMGGECVGGNGGEVVYQLTAPAAGLLTISLYSGTDMAFYVRTSCDDVATELGCVDNALAGGKETGALLITQGDVYYIFVEGFDAGEDGGFILTLKFTPSLPEDCSDGVDSDFDNLTDCEDADCAGDAACPLAATCAASAAAQASNAGDTTAGTTYFTGSCTGSAARESIYTYTPPGDGATLVTLTSDAALGLYARATCDDATTEIACTDIFIGGYEERLVLAAEGGVPVSIFVDGSTTAAAGPFTLDVQHVTLDEVEDNGDPASATVHVSPFLAAIVPKGDQDYVAIDVPGPSSQITAQIDDTGNGDCMGSMIDSELEIYGTDGATSLGFNDDIDFSGGNYCSVVTASGLAAGTYYVRASSSQRFAPSATFLYQLTVTVQ